MSHHAIRRWTRRDTLLRDPALHVQKPTMFDLSLWRVIPPARYPNQV
jgi:hypothetical protein